MSTIYDSILRWLRLETRPDNADDARYDHAEREMDRRLAALTKLDATIGAQQSQQSRVRDENARLEMLGVNRQILEERIEAEMQERRRDRAGGGHAGTS